ncbi:MAG: rod shape-determining protein [Clostridia bacterium]|nr:rod shape-determining protein [Clostridia bacterium]
MAKTVGVDLGTANTLICVKGEGIVIRSPSVVAINRDSREILTQGAEAKRMMGKTPTGILAFRPLKDGVITDADVTAGMLRNYFRAIGAISTFSRPLVVACIPHGVTEVEKRAMEDAAFEAGARKVSLMEEPIAAALGIGLPLGGSRGMMIVDIGGGTTEVAVISMGGIVASHSLRVAGDEMDSSIVAYLRKTRGVLVGESTAEELKLRVGVAHRELDRGTMAVSGMSLQRRMGVTVEIASGEVREALSADLDQIVLAIKQTLEQTPPEISSDLYDFGIMLTGGGSLLPGLGRLLYERTGLRVRFAKRPLESVCNGIFRVINQANLPEEFLHYRER